MQFQSIFSIFIFISTIRCENETVKTNQENRPLREWAIQMNEPVHIVRRHVEEHHLEFVGPIGSLENFYLVRELNHERVRRETIDDPPHERIKRHTSLLWMEEQKPKKRVKRGFIDVPDFASEQFELNENPVNRMRRTSKHPEIANDEFWPKQWYLNRYEKTNGKLPDHNVTWCWKRGYTGKGVHVTFLDDGLEWTHPDLSKNYDPGSSTDINDNDDDPLPRYDPTNENKHGTRCAGEVAATANNTKCIVGVAFGSKIGGVRMLDGPVTDQVEASSLSFNRDHIDIYSASWGPDDSGDVVDGPGRLAQTAFYEGTQHGRNGRGNIFVWASGNGGRNSDACSADGYTNSIYTLSISSISERGRKPWYLEECPSTIASTYSSGENQSGEREIVTTDLNHHCTDAHTGTSAAAPLAAGFIALALEANPSLTWRDVMHLIVYSSRSNLIPDKVDWNQNGIGLYVSHRYGFGLIDSGLLVELAEIWTNVPEMHTCKSVVNGHRERIPASSTISSTITFDACRESKNEIEYIEQVQVYVTISSKRRGAIEIRLWSPSNTESVLIRGRRNDKSEKGFNDWPILVTRLWGEPASGIWTLRVTDTHDTDAQLINWYLMVYGTKEAPINLRRSLSETDIIERISIKRKDLVRYSSSSLSNLHCHVACDESVRPCGPTEVDCKKCKYGTWYNEENKKNCVYDSCPLHTWYDYHEEICRNCSENCVECHVDQCRRCAMEYVRLPNGSCGTYCPPGFYLKNKINWCLPCPIEGCKKCRKSRITNNMICVKCFGYYRRNNDRSRYGNETIEQFISNTIEKKREIHTKQSTQLESVTPPDFCLAFRKCSLQQYFDKYLGRCVFCHPSCRSCFAKSENSCLSCNYNSTKHRVLVKNRCQRKCAELEFDSPYQVASNATLYEDHSLQFNVICRYCPPGCRLCNGSLPTNCTKCHLGYEMKGIEGCQPIMLKELKKIEVNCSIDYCLNCRYDIMNDYKEKCIKCKNSFYLSYDQGECVAECPENNFYSWTSEIDENHRLCLPCHPTCLKCHGSRIRECTECKNKSITNLSANQLCQNDKVCPQHTFVNNDGYCQDCHTSCKSCFGPLDKSCLSCFLEDYLVIPYNYCTKKCPEVIKKHNPYSFIPNSHYDQHYFPSVDTGGQRQCLPCNIACTSCHGPTSRECNKCASTYKLIDGHCRHLCASGTFYNRFTHQCEICSLTCLECFGEKNNCTKCFTHLSLYSNKCEEDGAGEIKKDVNEHLLVRKKYPKSFQLFFGVFFITLIVLLAVVFLVVHQYRSKTDRTSDDSSVYLEYSPLT
ncbi:hypothetical protein SNEBB_007136 [Seison nebaliae]|nr:hypothetical protein SNEBB_007136 [Seison nebaliae]